LKVALNNHKHDSVELFLIF